MASNPRVAIPDPPESLPSTVGELRAAGWRSSTVHQELRRNVARRIASRRPLVEGVLGFENTVLPQMENALLAGHDLILLGERGQAKTRIVRSLVDLLDEWIPAVAGSEVRDDPYFPISRYGRDLVASEGEATPVAWVHRSERFSEKLATPDTAIADLIGEVDPIKVAEGRYLADDSTIHFGLVPRSNRGIFAVNELPDLAERIQVGLLNVLEERDVQIRGFTIRLPLDLMLVATANPEDYTNRGRIITPLKDRFGAQIRTHYPPDIETELAILAQEVDLDRMGPGDDPTVWAGAGQGDGPGIWAGEGEGDAGGDGGLPKVTVPTPMAEVVAELSQMARHSPYINQRSGVSVRLSISNYESMVANSIRRALRLGEPEAVARVADLTALIASTQGKVEIEAIEEGREARILGQLLGAAVLAVFRRRVPPELLSPVVAAFQGGRAVHTGDDLPAAGYVALLDEFPELVPVVVTMTGAADGDMTIVAGAADQVASTLLSQPDAPSAGEVASAVELVLEGLHLTKRLNKDGSTLEASLKPAGQSGGGSSPSARSGFGGEGGEGGAGPGDEPGGGSGYRAVFRSRG